jgi:hypothetical protein
LISCCADAGTAAMNMAGKINRMGRKGMEAAVRVYFLTR